VGEVAAHRKGHPHDRVARLEEREVDREVRRRAGIGLDVGVLDAEEPPRALAGQRLEAIDDLLALVVALAGVALGVLVREHAPHRLEHGRRHVVLGGDEADRRRLALELVCDQPGDGGIDRLEPLRGVCEQSHWAPPCSFGAQARGFHGPPFPSGAPLVAPVATVHRVYAPD
jgi:hypothetical protein